MPTLISASILSADFSNLEKELHECERSGVDWIHVDVMDGHFVPNLTMGAFIVETCHRITSLPLDCHLMVDHPESLIDSFINAGATNITIHSEGNPNVHRTLQQITKSGCRAGIALNPGTPVAHVTSLLPFVDLVLIMSVNPGFSGQSFIPEMLEKIAEINHLTAEYPNIKYIQVDGGINKSTISEVVKAGANCCVTATAIFSNPNGIVEGVKSLRESLI